MSRPTMRGGLATTLPRPAQGRTSRRCSPSLRAGFQAFRCLGPCHEVSAHRARTRVGRNTPALVAPYGVFTCSPPSEVRLVGARHVGLVVGIVLAAVFRTHDLRPYLGTRDIGQGRGPWRREDLFILDRHVHLHELAAVLAEGIAIEQPVLLYVSLDGVFDVVVVAQPIALH